jgi:hypothetical protein
MTLDDIAERIGGAEALARWPKSSESLLTALAAWAGEELELDPYEDANLIFNVAGLIELAMHKQHETTTRQLKADSVSKDTAAEIASLVRERDEHIARLERKLQHASI